MDEPETHSKPETKNERRVVRRVKTMPYDAYSMSASRRRCPRVGAATEMCGVLGLGLGLGLGLL